MKSLDSRWIVCQIGAREHYAIPRAFHETGQLSALITDAWMPRDSPLRNLPLITRLRDRWHEELAEATVVAPTTRMLAFEAASKLLKRDPWSTITHRNRLFQKEAIRRLPTILSQPDTPTTLFSYSYAALELFREAKRRGWQTVLGQIDPGPREDALVQRLRAQHPEWQESSERAPLPGYWESWREECSLADRILVNSEWSRTLLIEEGVAPSKIEIIPLALGKPPVSPSASSTDPNAPPTLPLKLLFLGQAILRKGIHDLVEVARTLDPETWRVEVVGPHGRLPDNLPPSIHFHGSVPRSEAREWYANADLFVLPTHSDGFALTQLEAMSHGLPVIATPCCGEVVKEGVNGWLIPSGDPQALSDRLRRIQENPALLIPLREGARETVAAFGLRHVGQALTSPREPNRRAPAFDSSRKPEPDSSTP